MEILRNEQQGWSVVTVKGRLDAVSTPDFEKKVPGWTEEGAKKCPWTSPGWTISE